MNRSKIDLQRGQTRISHIWSSVSAVAQRARNNTNVEKQLDTRGQMKLSRTDEAEAQASWSIGGNGW